VAQEGCGHSDDTVERRRAARAGNHARGSPMPDQPAGRAGELQYVQMAVRTILTHWPRSLLQEVRRAITREARAVTAAAVWSLFQHTVDCTEPTAAGSQSRALVAAVLEAVTALVSHWP